MIESLILLQHANIVENIDVYKAYSSSSISGKYAEGSTCLSLWNEKEKTKKDTAKLLTNCIDIFFQMRISDMKYNVAERITKVNQKKVLVFALSGTLVSFILEKTIFPNSNSG